MRNWLRRMYYRVPWTVVWMSLVCGVILGAVMVVPGVMGWDVEMDVQFGIAAAMIIFVLFLTYNR